MSKHDWVPRSDVGCAAWSCRRCGQLRRRNFITGLLRRFRWNPKTDWGTPVAFGITVGIRWNDVTEDWEPINLHAEVEPQEVREAAEVFTSECDCET